MFTGIIEAVGRVAALELRGGDARLVVRCPGLDLSAARAGDSLAVNGVCLTAVVLTAGEFTADVSRETLTRTTLGGLVPGSAVNLERALTLATRVGGHLVAGHVDGLGRIVSRTGDGRSVRMTVELPAGLARYVASKGSVCVDGVSLTVNEVEAVRFGFNVVPHTLEATTLGARRPGDRVNVEVDLLARYVERLLSAGGELTRERLEEYGFAQRH